MTTGDATTAGPTIERERVVFWDVLRGVAVLGVLLANMPWMSIARHIAMNGEDDTPLGALDSAAKAFVFFFADTKFITTFSILFGAGLAWMSARADERGERFVPIYCRRLIALLVVGLLHGTFIWLGDILSSYALLGFVALCFRRRKTKTLLSWAAVLFVLCGALWMSFPYGDQSPPTDADEWTRRTRVAFSSGHFLAMIPVRAHWYFSMLPELLIGFGARTIAMFLLGMALVSSGVFTRPREHRPVFRRFLAIGLPLGIALHVAVSISIVSAHAKDPRWQSLALGAFYVGGFSQALGYIGAVALWTESRFLPGLRARLAAVGRMAFTNYLMHSILTALIFNYAGLFDRVGRAGGVLLSFAIFALQLWYSPLWLAHFRMGPFEWAWRFATYAKRPVFVRVRDVTTSTSPPAVPPPATP